MGHISGRGSSDLPPELRGIVAAGKAAGAVFMRGQVSHLLFARLADKV